MKRGILLVIDGMDTVNYTMGHTPAMSGLHGRTTGGTPHPEIIGAGTTITPIAHGMMGTGRNVVAPRPGGSCSGRPFDYYGIPAETIGDVAREAGMKTAAVGKSEAAIVLGGFDDVDYLLSENTGLDPTDWQQVSDAASEALGKVKQGLIVINFNGVDAAGHDMDTAKLIKAVGEADMIVERLLNEAVCGETMLIVAADHGTNSVTGKHNAAPTPFCIMTERLPDRVNLGIVHNFEIAVTFAANLGLRAPHDAMGRDLVRVALSGEDREYDYHQQFQQQMDRYLAASKERHEMVSKVVRSA